ncbi:D-alanyl-D-alanine carboxypeptidase family protein [Mycoavidus sp. B2-EB]|uniref:D-alanyl-D-alanine carboxypeptidase family protein n=1 Tax=Mycoavidus sp. B2-EB TaxID=2651972 RepID=UPI0016270A1C|nr:peptidase [Mycoavidus sp. B2-EB]
MQTMRFPILSSYFVSSLLGACLALTAALAQAQVPPPTLLARSWVLMDVTSNQVLAASKADERVEPASLTKLMTAYLVFDALKAKKIDLAQTIIPSEAVRRVKPDESRMFIQAHKPVTVSDLLHGMVVQSGNDAAIALAELIGGNEANFVDLMNQAAQRLGMKHTHYADVNGLPDPQHYTSASDVALLSARLIQDFPEYYSLFALKEYTYNKIRQFNRNRLLWLDSTVDGLKTGHTTAAGFCLVASAKRPLPQASDVSRRLVTVVMGERKEHDRVQDSLKMLNYGYQAYDMVRLYPGAQPVDTPRLFKGISNTLKVGVKSDKFITVPRGVGDKIKPMVHLDAPLLAPIKDGQTVGVVKVMADDKEIAAFPLVALEEIKEAGLIGRLWDTALLWLSKMWRKWV